MSGRVVVTRGGRVESVHRVHAVVADDRGRVVAATGDVDRPVFLRSAAKPFQALPLVEDGVVERVGIPEEELALCCASHSGGAEHVAGVRSLLGRLGLDEGALECGPHPPLGLEAADALVAAGRAPTPVHNNCSGKHAGMLALALHHGLSTRGYLEAEHPVQRRMLREVARWTELPEDAVGLGVDGCGVLCFAVPLGRAAAALGRFARAADRGDGARRIVGAMAGHPGRVAGPGRLDTELMARAGDRVVSKTGAEGVHGALLRGEGTGLALKVEDGGRRAADAALVALLDALGVLPGTVAEELRDLFAGPVRNTRDRAVGETRVQLALRRASGPAAGVASSGRGS